MTWNKFFVVRLLSLVGMILAVYLLWQQFFQPEFQVCNINDTINCDAIINGEVAKTFGIPTPLYGLVGYFAIFISATFKKKKSLLGFASFGIIFCLWIAYRELFELYVICPVCILCQIIMVTTFILSVMIQKVSDNK